MPAPEPYHDPLSGSPDAFVADPVGLARLHIVLVEPEIGGNAGAIGRTCVAAGAMLWMVRPLGFLLGERHRRRAGLDYWEHLTWRAVDGFDQIEAIFGPERLWLFSTRAAAPYTAARFRPGDALVFGPESRGLPERLLSAHAGRDLRIPMRAEARSLNLSSSVAIGLYEAVRQLDGGTPG